jgi:hypothetical protein
MHAVHTKQQSSSPITTNNTLLAWMSIGVLQQKTARQTGLLSEEAIYPINPCRPPSLSIEPQPPFQDLPVQCMIGTQLGWKAAAGAIEGDSKSLTPEIKSGHNWAEEEEVERERERERERETL